MARQAKWHLLGAAQSIATELSRILQTLAKTVCRLFREAYLKGNTGYRTGFILRSNVTKQLLLAMLKRTASLTAVPTRA